jgi:hypothetical protein
MVEKALGEKHLKRKKENYKSHPPPPQNKRLKCWNPKTKSMDLGVHFGYWESQVKVQGPNLYPILGREKIL